MAIGPVLPFLIHATAIGTVVHVPSLKVSVSVGLAVGVSAAFVVTVTVPLLSFPVTAVTAALAP